MRHETWVEVCPSQALSIERGVAALINGSQIALFRAGSDGHLYAIDNHDPASGANVLSRGIVGSAEAALYVASPMHKHRFDLGTGRCLDNRSLSVRVWPVREHAGVVEIMIDGDSVGVFGGGELTNEKAHLLGRSTIGH